MKNAPPLQPPAGTMPGDAAELVDLLYAVWVGDATVVALHRKVAEPRIRAAALRRLQAQAREELQAIEQKWREAYLAGDALNEAVIVEASLARQRAAAKIVALSYEPTGVVAKSSLFGAHLLKLEERARAVSFWAAGMLTAELVPDVYFKMFAWVARPAQQEADRALEAKTAIEPFGTADVNPRRRKAAEEVIQYVDQAKRGAEALIDSRA